MLSLCSEEKAQIFRLLVTGRVSQRSVLRLYCKAWRGKCYGWEYFAGDLFKISANIRKEDYFHILQNSVLILESRIIGQPFTFRQGNDFKHTTKVSQNILEERNATGKVSLMIWTPQNLGPLPIELHWNELGRKAKARQPHNAQQLWKYLKEVWHETIY